MHELTKTQLITKLGTLMFANAELGAQNELLFAELEKQARQIKELETLVCQLQAAAEQKAKLDAVQKVAEDAAEKVVEELKNGVRH